MSPYWYQFEWDPAKTSARLPIYLDAKPQTQLERLAQKRGKDIGDMVNELVKKEVELIEEFL